MRSFARLKNAKTSPANGSSRNSSRTTAQSVVGLTKVHRLLAQEDPVRAVQAQHDVSRVLTSRFNSSGAKPVETRIRKPDGVMTSRNDSCSDRDGGIWMGTNVGVEGREESALARRRCHPRSFQTGRLDRRESSAQLQPRRSRRASSTFMRSGSCRLFMAERMPHHGEDWKMGITERSRATKRRGFLTRPSGRPFMRLRRRQPRVTEMRLPIYPGGPSRGNMRTSRRTRSTRPH